METAFQFKKFSIHQERCAMKVGTDGVLLGAWAGLPAAPEKILDIGAGTGLIALMLAQRSQAAQIDAVEIDADAFEQCVENFEASPWADRLFCYHASFEEFLEEAEEHYDCIVSNPPFYTETVSGRNAGRNRARQNRSLPFDRLLEGIKGLLSPKGVFSTIIPYKEEHRLCELAASLSLYPRRVTRVKGNSGSPFIRSLLEFEMARVLPQINELVIEEGRHAYTGQYRQLTRDFYLNM